MVNSKWTRIPQKAPKQQPNPPPRTYVAAVNAKPRGELAELAFMHKAATLGFGVPSRMATTDDMTSSWRLTVACRVCRSSRQSPAPARLHPERLLDDNGKKNSLYSRADRFRRSLRRTRRRVVRDSAECLRTTQASTAVPVWHSGRGNTKYEQFREAWHLMKGS